MLKMKLLLLVVVSLLGGYLLGGVVRADHMPLTNGDFEEAGGSLSGWTSYTTARGTIGAPDYPMVRDFDIDGPSGPSSATKVAQFNVGTLTMDDKGYEGGGIYQNVHLVAGDYDIRANVAVDEDGSLFGVYDGGRFELLVDGVVLDSYEFAGKVGPNETKYALLARLQVLTAGDHEIRIRVTRSATAVVSLTQFVDNVVVALSGAGPSVEPEPTVEPEPSAEPEPSPEPAPNADPNGALGERDLKGLAIDALTPYAHESERIQNAIDKIKESLGPDIFPNKYWVDDKHLDPEDGHKVFDLERESVEELMDVVEEPDGISATAQAAAQRAIGYQVDADRILVTILLSELQGVAPELGQCSNPQQQQEADDSMAEAMRGCAAGDAARTNGQYTEAIEHYGRAWRHAIAALGGVSYGYDDSDDEDDSDGDD